MAKIRKVGDLARTMTNDIVVILEPNPQQYIPTEGWYWVKQISGCDPVRDGHGDRFAVHGDKLR